MNKKYALSGIIGGICFEIADYFLFLSPDLLHTDPDPAWLSMGNYRFMISAYLGLFGSILLLLGFISLYRMVKKTCSKNVCRFSFLGAGGITGICLAHFNIGCLSPLIYKSLLNRGYDSEVYLDLVKDLSEQLAPLSYLIIALFYTQLIVIVYGTVSGRFRIPKMLLIKIILATVLLSVIQNIVLSFFGIRGALGGMESLFEGMLYIVPYQYWRKHEDICD